jgi:hypothetical protein
LALFPSEQDQAHSCSDYGGASGGYLLDGEMQDMCFLQTTPTQTSALGKRKETSSCSICLYSRVNTINDRLHRGGPGARCLLYGEMQKLCFFDITGGQKSAMGERKKTFSGLIWHYARKNTINGTLPVIVAVTAPGASSTAKDESYAFLTQHLDRRAHSEKEDI